MRTIFDLASLALLFPIATSTAEDPGFVWARRIGGMALVYGNSVAVDSAGNVYATGRFDGTADFDPGPGTHDLTSAGGRDIFISKLDSNGDFAWAGQMGGSGPDDGHSIAVDGAGNVYTTGIFWGTADLDPGSSTYDLTSEGSQDNFISLLDSDGGFVWAGRFGNAFVGEAPSLAVDGAGHMYSTGYFADVVDFDPGPCTHEIGIPDGGYEKFVVKLGGSCDSFVDRGVYGTLLFPPLCSRNADELPGGPGEDYTYASTELRVNRPSNDAIYLSSDGLSLAPLAVDEAVHVSGGDSGLGPYAYKDGIPPFIIDVPIDCNLVSLPAHDITSLVPEGSSQVLFELVDTQRGIYGNTAVYLVRDCAIYLSGVPEVTLGWVSYDVDVTGLPSNLDAVSGMLSELRTDADFSRACNLGTFIDTTQVVDTRPGPASGEGYYYLVDGTCAQPVGFGDSSAGPRTGLPPGSSCP